MKKNLLSIIVCMFLVLCGCTSKPDNMATSAPNTVENPTVTTESASINTTESTSENVVNNCSYFVKKGSKVYFREYGNKATDNLAVFGQFLYNPTGEQSYICSYDEKTQKTSQEFIDFGFGNITLINDVFYMNGYEIRPNEKHPYVYAVDINGKDVKLPQKYSGEIKDVLQDNSMLLILNSEYENGYEVSITGVLSDGNEAFCIKSANTLNYIGSYNDFIIYSESSYSDKLTRIWYKSVSPDNYAKDPELILDISCDDYQFFDFGKIVVSEVPLVYIPVAVREGTGSMFDYGMIVAYTPGYIDSGHIARELKSDEDMEMPYLYIRDDGLCFSKREPNDLYIERTSFEENGDLYIADSNGEGKLLVRNFIEGAEYYAERRHLLHSEIIDNTGYCMVCKMVYDEEGSIGWRDGFRILSMEYIRVNDDGSYSVIDKINY